MTFKEIIDLWLVRAKTHSIKLYDIAKATGHHDGYFWNLTHLKKNVRLNNLFDINTALSLVLVVDSVKLRTTQEALDWLFKKHEGRCKLHLHDKAGVMAIYRWNTGRSEAKYNAFQKIVHELGFNVSIEEDL